jgi:hypothetical protein
MRGLLADANVHHEIEHLRRLLSQLDLLDLLEQLGLSFSNFVELVLPLDLDDRRVWTYCQLQEWVLLTDNRNHRGPTSLEATLRDSWKVGCLPVVTISSKAQFQTDRIYAAKVASDLAEVLYGISQEGRFRDQARIFVPFR